MSIDGIPWTAFGSDVGKKRSTNEDYVLACEPHDETLRMTHGCLYIVADGIGGGAAGEVASQFAARAVAYHYYHQIGEPAHLLRNSIVETNSVVYDHAQSKRYLSTMGTTLVAAAIRGDTLHIAHVGDSRAYLIHETAVQRLTQDHNLAAQLARDGIITAAQVEHHPQRNLLLRSVGGERSVTPDQSQIHLRQGDILLLCTDGLTRHIKDFELAHIAATNTPTQATCALLDSANHRGGHDNISVLIVRWGCEKHEAAPHQGILPEPPPMPSITAITVSAPKPPLAGLTAG